MSCAGGASRSLAEFAENQKKSSRRLAISQMWCIVCVLPKGSELLPLPKIGDKTSHQP